MNKSVLAARLDRLQGYLGILKTVQQYDLQRFVDDPFIHGTAERYLHLAIECLLDIGNHVISDRSYPKPDSYADIFKILCEKRIISPSIYKELEGMASFRNVLVHDYLRLDRQKVYEIVRDKVKTLEKLASVFSQIL